MIGQPHDEGDEDRTEIVEELQTVHEDGYKLGGEVVIVDGVHGAGNVLGHAIGHRVVDRRETVDRPRDHGTGNAHSSDGAEHWVF